MATRRPLNNVEQLLAKKNTETPGPAPKRRTLKPFRAADHPSRDFRGETMVNGVKMRV